METIIGIMAGSLTTIAFFPQVIKTWKTKSTKDISIAMFMILCTGILSWIIYGILREDWPVIIANVVTFILAMNILILKIVYR